MGLSQDVPLREKGRVRMAEAPEETRRNPRMFRPSTIANPTTRQRGCNVVSRSGERRCSEGYFDHERGVFVGDVLDILDVLAVSTATSARSTYVATNTRTEGVFVDDP